MTFMLKSIIYSWSTMWLQIITSYGFCFYFCGNFYFYFSTFCQILDNFIIMFSPSPCMTMNEVYVHCCPFLYLPFCRISFWLLIYWFMLWSVVSSNGNIINMLSVFVGVVLPIYNPCWALMGRELKGCKFLFSEGVDPVKLRLLIEFWNPETTEHLILCFFLFNVVCKLLRSFP